MGSDLPHETDQRDNSHFTTEVTIFTKPLDLGMYHLEVKSKT